MLIFPFHLEPALLPTDRDGKNDSCEPRPRLLGRGPLSLLEQIQYLQASPPRVLSVARRESLRSTISLHGLFLRSLARESSIREFPSISRGTAFGVSPSHPCWRSDH